MRDFFVGLYVPVLASFALAQQNQYRLLTENVTLNYADPKYIAVIVGTFKRNHTNAINVTATFKCDLPENTMIFQKSWKWLGNDYRVPTIQIKSSVKDAIQMESFDLQSFWIYHATPPVVWPIKKGVTYRLEGWIPDSTKYPLNLPDGKWKTQVSIEFPNKTKVVEAIWYFNITYYK